MADAALAAFALADAWVFAQEATWPAAVSGIAAALAILVRRRLPVAVFVLTLVALAFASNVLAVLIALFTLAEHARRRRTLAVGVLLYAVLANLQDAGEGLTGSGFLIPVGYSLMAGSAAVMLGQLVMTRRDLARRMAELHDVQEHQRDLHAQAALARERVQLAREMHDVVSHQVSLIAVHAGALQVSAESTGTKEAARTIRKLSTATLDELRHMVALLRASGSHTVGLAPQPTLVELADLIAGSGLDTRLVGRVPDDASAAVQRTAYRIVQEALTNARKHAPGATVLIELDHPGPGLDVTVTNTAPRRTALPLPSSQHGLIGLRERAENLGGTLISGPTPDGGYRIHAHIPLRTG
ncbi:sensor histidine kinase [Streptomyces sp. NBC_01565]|uniref:sensor histidine kinase n=1 Tax=unclassified Streptomyces TaxID=2593676 RepID=UPI0022521B93|nr:sensor histidine kinase [Streptomyces sp. NBC_01565]MCX4546285.1 histidine kinase [Streptomyces sp. NBC_01565]